MQYHFHLIRNILKLPYCFPSETPSAPRSDNQAEGCQGPSVPGQVPATQRKGIQWKLPAALVEFKRLLLAPSGTPGPWLGLGSGPPGRGKGERPRQACKAGWVRSATAQELLGSSAGKEERSNSPFS